MKNISRLLKDSTQINGISGHEEKIACWFIDQIKEDVSSIRRDHLGNVFAYLNEYDETKKTVMLEGHLDEVGFIVKKILPNGIITVLEVGGWFDQVVLSSRVTLTTFEGKEFKGVVSSVPPHNLTNELKNSPYPISKMLFDFGFKNSEEVYNHGIRVGDMITLDGPYTEVSNNRVITKAVDNRYSLVSMILLAKRLKNKINNYNIVFVASVQEEVGLRGAHVVSKQVKPDLAIVLDCSPADDTDISTGFGKIGEGPLLRVFDRSFIAHQKFIRYFESILIKHGIKHQYFISNGGTDAGIIHQSENGIMTLTACICARNIHTSGTMVDLNDIENAIEGVYQLCTSLENDDWGQLLFNYQTF